MASVIAFDTIEQLLRAQWTATPIFFENESWQVASTPAHFVYVEIFGDIFDQASLGADPRTGNLWRERGQLYLHVMTVRDSGSRQARLLAGQLVDLFRGQDIGTLTFLDASIGAGDPGKADGNYYAMTATIDWERDQ